MDISYVMRFSGGYPEECVAWIYTEKRKEANKCYMNTC